MAERPEYKPFLASECEILTKARETLGKKYECSRDCLNCPVISNDRVFSAAKAPEANKPRGEIDS